MIPLGIAIGGCHTSEADLIRQAPRVTAMWVRLEREYAANGRDYEVDLEKEQ